MPEAFIARLTAPRLLQPQTDYLACVVPAFRGGVEAGLGQPVDVASSAQDAWDDDAGDDAPVMLPVYFSGASRPVTPAMRHWCAACDESSCRRRWAPSRWT